MKTNEIKTNIILTHAIIPNMLDGTIHSIPMSHQL